MGDKRGRNKKQIYKQSIQIVIEGIQEYKPGGKNKITQNYVAQDYKFFKGGKTSILHIGKFIWGKKNK